jgi:SAM-dependent methyltransferase
LVQQALIAHRDIRRQCRTASGRHYGARVKAAPDDEHWAEFNSTQHDRPVRELCRQVMALAGPGAGRTAVDLGCGAGTESRALCAAGWRVHAIDRSPQVVPEDGLTVADTAFADLTALPCADLIYAGYSLPYQPPESFERVWALVRASLRPGGWFAGNIFGERDEWAGAADMTFLDVPSVRALFDGTEIAHWYEEDEVGPAWSGPKHWHVVDVIARIPG